MSYVFFPPRTENYYPAGFPYLAGLRGMGSYASDMATYKVLYAKYEKDLAAWNAEKKQYDADVTAWSKAVATAQAKYKTKYAAYKKDLAAYSIEYKAYQMAVGAWIAAKDSNTVLSQTIAQNFGLSLPQSYYDNGACLSAAEHAALPRCSTVKGLGGYRAMGSVDPNCGMAKLPVCQLPVPTIRDSPVAPAAPVMPAKPTLRPQPMEPGAPVAPPPDAASTPATVPSSGGGASQPASSPVDSPVTPAAAPAGAGMIRNGLLLVALLGGGYLVYRTLKKPKAQAA